MTVSTTNNTVEYTGDGSTVAFSFPYLVYQASHMAITIDGVASSSWSGATYGDSAGITVTFSTAPTNLSTITLQRIVPYTQDTDLENFDGNPADITEKQFDLLAMADQQLAEQTARSILAPIGTSLTSNNITGTIDTTTRLLTITTAGPATSTVGNISSTINTVFTSLATGDLMQYDGTNWVNIIEIPTAQIADNAVTSVKVQASAITAAKIGTDAVTPVKVQSTVNIIGSIGGGTQDIDLDSGRTVSGTVDTGTTTFTFSNPKVTGNEDGFVLYLTDGGSQTLNWPASVDWANGVAPTLTAAGVDVLVFSTIDGGIIWNGFVSGLDVS